MENDMTEVLDMAKKLTEYCDGQDCNRCGLHDEEYGTCIIDYPKTWNSNREPYVSKINHISRTNFCEAGKVDGEGEPKPSFTPAEARKRVLDDAATAVCSDRNLIYGEVEDNFNVIAWLWNAYIGAKLPNNVSVYLTAKEVADMMILFKVGRTATALEDHRDTYVDIAGYAACAGGMCK